MLGADEKIRERNTVISNGVIGPYLKTFEILRSFGKWLGFFSLFLHSLVYIVGFNCSVHALHPPSQMRTALVPIQEFQSHCIIMVYNYGLVGIDFFGAVLLFSQLLT